MSLLSPAAIPIPASPPRPDGTLAPVTLPELLAALSRALDLTDGAPMGHAVRTCTIGMRMAAELRLGERERTALYYALLLKDAGCSSDAARIAALFASDDRTVKPRLRLMDRQRPVRLARATWGALAIGRPITERVRRLVALARAGEVARDLARTRGERGAEIARGLGLDELTVGAIRALHEHWNGRGHPDGLRGDAIPLLARIASVAQAVELFHASLGEEMALRVVRQRRGRWFDPRVADVVLSWRRDADWWRRLGDPWAEARLAAAVPGDELRPMNAALLDQVAETFAGIVDAKSPYTSRHSRNVARYAAGIAATMGLQPAEVESVRRAGLLHDLGKLGVSNRILDKNGPLDAGERGAIERHPLYTWEILARVGAFRGFAWTAATHHEALDGSGYPWRLDARHLDARARVLAVADAYEALTAERPYRAGFSRSQALGILAREKGTRLDARAVDAMHAWDPGEG